MKIKNILLIIALIYVCVSLSGCCGHSSGGNNLAPANVTTIGETKVNDDGSVAFSGDGISLSALPNTFSKNTTIKFTKVTGGDLLSYLGMSKRAITLDSNVYGIDISPKQELLNNVATLTIDLSSKYDSSKKYYFSVNRDTPTLVTSENVSRSLSFRAASKKSFDLGFVTTFNYVALAHLNKEIFIEDPKVWCDNPSKEVVNNKYPNNVSIFAQISTKDKINDVFNINTSYTLAARTDESNLTKLSHKDSPLTSRKAQGKSKLTYAYIDLTKSISYKIDEHTIQFDAFFNSINKSFKDIPRKVVIESVFTNKDNIPISSQEYLLHFRTSKRPYVLSSYPSNKDIITNANQIKNIVVNFSESMNPTSVEDALTITSKKLTYSKSKGNLKFTWSDNNKKLAMNGNFTLSNATGTFNIKIAKDAASSLNVNIAKDAYSVDAENIEWSFNYNKNDFYVIMTSPKPGDTKVPVRNNSNGISNTGTEITLQFSENFIGSLDSLITLKTKKGEKVKFSGRSVIDEKLFIIIPSKALNYNQEYIVEVSGSVKNFNDDKTLGETYRANFITKEPFDSGSGTSNDPYLITNQEELSNINLEGYLNTDKYYKLVKDINYVKPPFTEGKLNAYWQPIGDNDNPFVGHFNGNNKSINNLKIIQNSSYTGLFGKIVNSTITNLKLNSVEVNGRDIVGILSGHSLNSSISNVNVTDFDLNVTDEKAGGLVGFSNSTQINKCSLQTSKNVFGTVDYCGGIVGYLSANSKITNSTFTLTNNSKIIGSNIIGGLVGYIENSKILDSDFIGTIDASGNEIGGVVGKASNSYIESCSVLNGSVLGSSNIGGICGNLSSSSSVEKCYTTSNVTGAENNVGGLVGYSENSDIINSYNTDVIIDNKANCCGGIVGYIKDSNIDYCYSRANVSGNDSVGGLAGLSEGSVTISNSAALNKELKGTNKDNLNKILGQGKSSIKNSYSLSSTIISFVGAESDSYKHTTNPLDGKVKNSVSAIYDNIILDSSIWETNTGDSYAILK